MRTWILAILCAANAARPAAAFDTAKFLEPVKTSQMTRPAAAAAAASRYYVLDAKKGALFIYDASGGLLKSVGKRGDGKEEFDYPGGIALGSRGRLYVADTGNSRIQVLDADGGFLWSFGGRGSEPGKFKDPRSVAVGQDGRVYVADTGNSRVQIFTDEGIFLRTVLAYDNPPQKKPRSFSAPARVGVDPSDNIYVYDSGIGHIVKLDPLAASATEYAAPGGDFVVDPYGFLYILDADNVKVVEFNAAGKGSVTGKVGSAGAGASQFKKPAGLALSPEGNLIVVDAGNKRLQRIEVVNKLKTAVLEPNRAARLSVSGPSRSWAFAAQALAAEDGALYAYLPKEGQFAVLDESGKAAARFGVKTGKGPSVTRDTQGFAVSKKLGVYVSDTPDNRLQHFTLDGTWKENIAESTGWLDSKKKEGRLKDPRGVAINDEGTIYVADAGNRRIDAFSPDGNFITAIGPKIGSVDLVEPASVVWDKAGFVYFADKGLKKIFKCDPSGTLVASWGQEGDGPGQFKSPEALAYDGNHNLYVLDGELKRVSAYAKDGSWIADFFSGGKGERELSEPTALQVQGSRLVFADKGKGAIVSFDLHPLLAPPAQVSTSAAEGIVSLSWSPIDDPWAAQYRVYRSTEAAGFYVEVGTATALKLEDRAVAAPQRYFYKVATESKTGDVGAPGAPVEVTVAAAANRAPVQLSTITIGNVFSANYKWYLKNPVGAAVVTNNVNLPYENVKLTFRLKDFMDFGYDTELKTLEPQKSVEVPLIATLNNKILEVTEDTPIQAEFTLTYFENGKQLTVSLTKPIKVYSRNAIAWDEPRRIANFITPKDPPVLEYAREVLRQAPKKPEADALNENLLTALHLWDALGESGVKFFTNPGNPYETVSEDPNFPVDYTQFPRETLKRKSGQCDDLTTLFISMLDGTKVPAAILDFPGHMALMFDTGAEDPAEAGLPEEDLVSYEGTYWVPLEATLVGRPFNEAVHKAAQAYKAESGKGKAAVIDVRKAWEDFEPATMPASDWNAEVPKPEARRKRFEGEVAALFGERYDLLKKRYEEALKKDSASAEPRLGLGLLEYQAGRKEAALAQFNKVLEADSKNAAALNNLGNVSFLEGDYAAAEERYLKAAEAGADDPDIWMNLVKAEVHLKNKGKASEYGKKVAALDSSLGPSVESLLNGL